MIAISILGSAGILLHSIRLDSALAAWSNAAIVTDQGVSLANLQKSDQHPQTEISSFTDNTRGVSSQPAMQPRNENEKKYIAQKRTNGNEIESDYIWPSI